MTGVVARCSVHAALAARRRPAQPQLPRQAPLPQRALVLVPALRLQLPALALALARVPALALVRTPVPALAPGRRLPTSARRCRLRAGQRRLVRLAQPGRCRSTWVSGLASGIDRRASRQHRWVRPRRGRRRPRPREGAERPHPALVRFRHLPCRRSVCRLIRSAHSRGVRSRPPELTLWLRPRRTIGHTRVRSSAVSVEPCTKCVMGGKLLQLWNYAGCHPPFRTPAPQGSSACSVGFVPARAAREPQSPDPSALSPRWTADPAAASRAGRRGCRRAAAG